MACSWCECEGRVFAGFDAWADWAQLYPELAVKRVLEAEHAAACIDQMDVDVVAAVIVHDAVRDEIRRLTIGPELFECEALRRQAKGYVVPDLWVDVHAMTACERCLLEASATWVRIAKSLDHAEAAGAQWGKERLYQLARRRGSVAIVGTLSWAMQGVREGWVGLKEARHAIDEAFDLLTWSEKRVTWEARKEALLAEWTEDLATCRELMRSNQVVRVVQAKLQERKGKR